MMSQMYANGLKSINTPYGNRKLPLQLVYPPTNRHPADFHHSESNEVIDLTSDSYNFKRKKAKELKKKARVNVTVVDEIDDLFGLLDTENKDKDEAEEENMLLETLDALLASNESEKTEDAFDETDLLMETVDVLMNEKTTRNLNTIHPEEGKRVREELDQNFFHTKKCKTTMVPYHIYY
eukprot:snap_masked-scaffold_5-processed-gene-0.31-mRNA-1 protein AED:1.00 eAED:1.00 QI:0/-1/0/0/-1/1/1/0/179